MIDSYSSVSHSYDKGAGALNKPYWAYKESPCYIMFLPTLQ